MQLDIYARLTEAQLRNRLDPDNALFIVESPKGNFRLIILMEENRRFSTTMLPTATLHIANGDASFFMRPTVALHSALPRNAASPAAYEPDG